MCWTRCFALAMLEERQSDSWWHMCKYILSHRTLDSGLVRRLHIDILCVVVVLLPVYIMLLMCAEFVTHYHCDIHDICCHIKTKG